jgi:pilus assembly protein CpaB
MKSNIIPIGLAAVAFIIVVALMQPAPTIPVVVASRNIAAGHVISEGDVTTQKLPTQMVPTNAILKADGAVGQSVSMDRTSGDMILASQLGEAVRLQPDERAIAVNVQDASGMAGLLKPGDLVGVTAILFQQGGEVEGAFSKVTVENLRVLYMSPTFKALDPSDQPVISDSSNSSPSSTNNTSPDRAKDGAVVLAVPVKLEAVQYDFSETDSPSQKRSVNAIELLSALNAASNAKLSLYLMPRGASAFQTGGLWLPDLVITPGPTPTPTATLSPAEMSSVAAQTPTATPGK